MQYCKNTVIVSFFVDFSKAVKKNRNKQNLQQKKTKKTNKSYSVETNDLSLFQT